MGVSHLWEVLKPAGQITTLGDISIHDGMLQNEQDRGLRLGVDATSWFIQSKATSQRGENPQLAVLFFRCARLLRMGMLPLFVFDGPARPSTKRGKHIRTGSTDPLIASFKEIIHAFGFEFRAAPGEAEAELAYLSQQGTIDAVLTDDADALVFGAKRVLRTSSSLRHLKKDETIQFTLDSILTHVGLSNDDLILFALLCGGDYDPQGIKGCGPVTAVELARASYGHSLMASMRRLLCTDQLEELHQFLNVWRTSLQKELCFNQFGHLSSCRPQIASNISDSFPNLQVLHNYMYPVTSQTLGTPVTPPTWTAQPNVERLAYLCERLFDWGDCATIVRRFTSLIYPGVAVRALQISTALSPRFHLTKCGYSLFGDSQHAHLIASTARTRKNKLDPDLVEEQFDINLVELVSQTTAKLHASRYTIEQNDFANTSSLQLLPCRIWLPACVVKLAKSPKCKSKNTKGQAGFLGFIDLTQETAEVIDLTGDD